MSPLRLLVPFTVALVLPASIGAAQEGTKPPAKVEAKDAQAPKETWAVVQVGDHMKIMKSSEIEDARKKLEAEHKAAMAKHQAAMKEAEAKKAKFDQPAPLAQSLTVVAADIKSADEAAAQLKKLKAEQDKAKEAKDLKEKGKEAGKEIKETGKEKIKGSDEQPKKKN